MMNYIDEMSRIDAHYQNKHYKECVTNCRSLMETALRDLYTQLLPKLLPEESQNVRTQEKILGEHYKKLTFGKLLELYRKADIYSYLEKLGLSGKQLKKIGFDDLIDSTNDIVHPNKVATHDDAEQIRFKTRQFLKLANLIKEGDVPDSFSRTQVYETLCKMLSQLGIAESKSREFLNKMADDFKLSRAEQSDIEKNAGLKVEIQSSLPVHSYQPSKAQQKTVFPANHSPLQDARPDLVLSWNSGHSYVRIHAQNSTSNLGNISHKGEISLKPELKEFFSYINQEMIPGPSSTGGSGYHGFVTIPGGLEAAKKLFLDWSGGLDRC